MYYYFFYYNIELKMPHSQYPTVTQYINFRFLTYDIRLIASYDRRLHSNEPFILIHFILFKMFYFILNKQKIVNIKYI